MISHPALKPIADERADIDTREVALRASIRALLDPHEEALAAWKVQHDEAVELGARPPQKPDAPDTRDLDRGLRHLDNERERLDVKERKVLAQIAPEIEADLAARLDEVLIRIGPHVTSLLEDREEVHDILRDLAVVRGAVDQCNPNGRPAPGWGTKARTRSTITIHDLIDAQINGTDLLAAHPVPGIPTDAVQVDHAPVQQRIGGLNPPGAFGTPPTQPKRQPPREDFT